MPSRTLVIAGEIAGRHPEILVGGLLASNLRRATPPPLPEDTAQALLGQDVTIELVADHPLVKDWRTAIAACGAPPRRPFPTTRPRPWSARTSPSSWSPTTR